jgi:hypothetical protein
MSATEKVRVGAVIKFAPGTDVERAQAFLDRLVERDIIQPAVAHQYDGEYCGPVWYIP